MWIPVQKRRKVSKRTKKIRNINFPFQFQNLGRLLKLTEDTYNNKRDDGKDNLPCNKYTQQALFPRLGNLLRKGVKQNLTC